MGRGPATFSTKADLVVPFRVPYDCNMYYSRLGVHPLATKRELKRAYQKKRGWRSYRLTYILTQLLRKRKAYDATPIGSFFMDEEVEGWLRKLRSKQVSELRGAGDLLAAELLADSDEWEEVVPLNLSDPPVTVTGYPYSYYLWDSECDDEDRLSRWQELLLSALRKEGVDTEIALGFVGGKPIEVRTVGYRLVIFLGDDQEPSELLAEVATHRVREHQEKKCPQQTQTSVREPKLPRKPQREATSQRLNTSRSRMENLQSFAS